jgi:putative hydrolase of the HAD superfamily
MSLLLTEDVDVMIKCVISDMGNVILTFDIWRFYRKISESSPYSPEGIARVVRENLKLLRPYSTGKITPEQFFDAISQKLRLDTDYDAFFSAYNNVFDLNPDVEKSLRKLTPKYRLILLSNTDVMHFAYIREAFPEIFFFDDYVLSYEVGLMKPNPQIYEIAIEKAKARAGECVFIDDLEENISAAAEMGIQTIHFRPQTDLEAELKKLNLSF